MLETRRQFFTAGSSFVADAERLSFRSDRKEVDRRP
jgi:hypothetical protein